MPEVESGVPEQVDGVDLGATDFSEFSTGAGVPSGITAWYPLAEPSPVTPVIGNDAEVGNYIAITGIGDPEWLEGSEALFTIDSFTPVDFTLGEVLGLFFFPEPSDPYSAGGGIMSMVGSDDPGVIDERLHAYVGASILSIGGIDTAGMGTQVRSGGSAPSNATPGVDLGAVQGGWFWLRHRCLRPDDLGRHIISLKYWRYGDEEPADFDIVHQVSYLHSVRIQALITGGGRAVGCYLSVLAGLSARCAYLGFSSDPEIHPPPSIRGSAPPEYVEKAWSFVLDGHVFYVLSFTNMPSLVYDVTTGQWGSWFTGAYDPASTEPGGYWNMYRGIVWKGRVIASDASAAALWELDPSSMLDEGAEDIHRAVTAYQPIRGSASVRQGSLRLTARKEDPNASSTVRMRYSDDGGRTWSLWRSVTLEASSVSKRIEWRSLGKLKAPGRMWDIEDVGGLVRIEGSEID